MKNSVVNLLVFTCFLVVGYTFSVRFYQNDAPILSATSSRITSDIKNTIATLDNGQRNLLLIYTSSMSSPAPHLEGIWLASYLPTDTTIQFLPVYGDINRSDFGRQLDQSFNLIRQKGNLKLDPSFVNVLQKNNYWWSGYIVFDQNSLEEVNKFFGGDDLDNKTKSYSSDLDGIPTVLEDSLNAYSTQVATFHYLCSSFSAIEKNPELSQLIDLVGTTILTDLDTNQFYIELELLSTNPHQPACRFPTLEVSRIAP